MLDRHLMKRAGRVLSCVGGILAVLSACAGSSGQAAPVAGAEQATTVAGAPPSANLQSALPPADNANGDLLSKGRLVFEKTAGGVGCAYCHGLDGSGKGPAGVGAAYIRGVSEAQVRNALENVAIMSIVKLSDAQIAAVVAYLQYLATQP